VQVRRAAVQVVGSHAASEYAKQAFSPSRGNERGKARLDANGPQAGCADVVELRLLAGVLHRTLAQLVALVEELDFL
jgi:hypothetical protein